MILKKLKIADLKPHPMNYNTHPEAQIREIEKSLEQFDQFKNIVVCQNIILAGHGLVEAAKRKGMTEIYALIRDDLTENQQKALLVADNAIPFANLPDTHILGELLGSISTDFEIPGMTDEWLHNINFSDNLNDIEFNEYDESITDDIELCRCPHCGHEHAKKK
jgi:hypothetical protein